MPLEWYLTRWGHGAHKPVQGPYSRSAPSGSRQMISFACGPLLRGNGYPARGELVLLWGETLPLRWVANRRGSD
jgi:hypothetical protein